MNTYLLIKLNIIPDTWTGNVWKLFAYDILTELFIFWLIVAYVKFG